MTWAVGLSAWPCRQELSERADSGEGDGTLTQPPGVALRVRAHLNDTQVWNASIGLLRPLLCCFIYGTPALGNESAGTGSKQDVLCGPCYGRDKKKKKNRKAIRRKGGYEDNVFLNLHKN